MGPFIYELNGSLIPDKLYDLYFSMSDVQTNNIGSDNEVIFKITMKLDLIYKFSIRNIIIEKNKIKIMIACAYNF